MTGDDALSPGRREASRSRWAVVVLSGQDRAPGQGLARWVRPQKISTSQSGENWALTAGWLWREIQVQVSTSCWTSVEARVVDLQ